MDWGVGDLLALSKLTWDLYHNCYLVAKEAPDEFRSLIGELNSLRGILKNLSEDADSDGSYLKNLDPKKKELLERSVKSCNNTLLRLQGLLEKYKEMGIGDGIQFWQRISWTTKKRDITDIKSSIRGHATTIQLCLTNAQNSSLARIESRLLPALERQESAVDYEPSIIKEDESGHSTNLTLNRYLHSSESSRAPQRRWTESTEPTLVDPSSYTPPPPDEDTENLSPVTSAPRHRNSSSSFQTARRPSSINSNRLNLSPSLHEDDPRDTRENARRLLEQLPAKFTNGRLKPVSPRKAESFDVNSEVGYAVEELSKVKEHERNTRPLRIPSRRNVPQPDKHIAEEFQKSADAEMEYRKLNMREWLRLGTWWLLKAKYNLNSMEKPQAESLDSTMRTSLTSPSTQGYVDLLKVSWILFNVVLSGEYDNSLRGDENRNILYNLFHALEHEAKPFRVGSPDEEAMKDPEVMFDIFESFQASEEDFGDDFGNIQNSRWVTVQQGDAGDIDERAIFRTFVDAAIGGKNHKVFPKGAPYLLVLSTRKGESEPKITLCNQSGTMCLTRDFTIDDLSDFGADTNPIFDVDYYEDLQSIPLSFGDFHTSLSFPDQSSLKQFIKKPRAYFNAVRRREPRELPRATEAIIFKASVDIIEQLHPSSLKPMSDKHRFSSCHVRILETTCNQGWRTTRRLVTSSSADERNPWCNEFFLPIDRVQLKSDLGNQVTMKWSDCSQEDYTQTNGQYATYFSHVYNDARPNNSLRLVFHSSNDANDFQRAILTLKRPESFSWEHDQDRGHIYEMEDMDPIPMKYKAILLVRKSLDWTFANVFYHYRHTDFNPDTKTCRIAFPNLSYTNYVSNHYQELYKPKETPQFSHCEKRHGSVTIDFQDSDMLTRFLTKLSSNARLIFARRALYISTKAPSKLSGTAKSNKGAAELLVWRVGNATKIVSRWNDIVADKWISVDVPGTGLKHSHDSTRASMPGAKYDRGTMLDIGELFAVKPKNKEPGARKEGYLTWTFSSVRDQEEFVSAVEGKASDAYKQLDEFLENLGPRH